MGIFANIRERIPFIKFLVNAQKTLWYPALFALLAFISGISNYTVYLPILWLMISFLLFSVFFTDDGKVFFTPLLMIYFALGCDSASNSFHQSNGNMLSSMDDRAFIQVIIIGVIGVASLVTRLVIDGSVAAVFKKRRFFTLGIIAMDIAFVLNGIFSAKNDILNLIYGLLLAAGFTATYFLALSILENSYDAATYICYVTLATAYSTLLQILYVALKLFVNDKFFFHWYGNNVINKDALTLGWGVSTVIAAVFVLGIPAAMYLAKEKRWSAFSYFSCFAFLLGTIIINTRGAMAVGTAVFVLLTVVCCIKGKNRVRIRIYSAITAVICIVGLIYINYNVMSITEILGILRIDKITDSGRGALWDKGFSDFLSSPVFGIGFNEGAYTEELRRNNFYSNMYHCILVQIPASMGVVGVLAFIFHVLEFAVMMFKKFSIKKMLILMVPLMILGMSLLDNFFFYINFQLFYGAFIAVAEKISQTSEDDPITKGAKL